VRTLLQQYERWTGTDLCFQDFEHELAELPGDYVAPGGVLLVARVQGRLIGCVAAHRWSEGVCEMKRLFVQDEARGSGCGSLLVQCLLDWARNAGVPAHAAGHAPGDGGSAAPLRAPGVPRGRGLSGEPVPGARFLALDL
jgi:carbonic anhydrase